MAARALRVGAKLPSGFVFTRMATRGLSVRFPSMAVAAAEPPAERRGHLPAAICPDRRIRETPLADTFRW